ncbi:MAG: hypothetical protein KatS3mg102_2904 [Planctomycetota bacterium]|nr:MAG: hypothetical protein KatS3mg102_2904 [Planctomycetota bacterium]
MRPGTDCWPDCVRARGAAEPPRAGRAAAAARRGRRGTWRATLLVPLLAMLAAAGGAARAAEAVLPEPVRAAAAEAAARLLSAEAEPAQRRAHLGAALAAAERGLLALARCAAGSQDPGAGAPPDAAEQAALAAAVARARAELERARAAALLGLGRVPEALAACRRAEAAAPGPPAAALLEAAVSLRAGEPAAALAAAERARAAAELGVRERARAALLAGRALLQLGRAAEAATAAEAALALAPLEPAARALRAHAQRRARLRYEGVALSEERLPGLRILSEVGPGPARAVAARLRELLPLFQRRFPLSPGDPRARFTVPVHLLAPLSYARLGGPAARARAFYQRDERAIFALAEHTPELVRLVAHEAFHAHLHRLVEEPPAWLDEGFADRFAAARLLADGTPAFLPHPVRLRDLQIHLRAGREVRLRELCLASRQQLYEERWVAAAWGWVHVLAESAAGGGPGARDPLAGRLERYLAAVLDGGSPEEAWQAAFADAADLAALEAAWHDRIQALGGG